MQNMLVYFKRGFSGRSRFFIITLIVFIQFFSLNVFGQVHGESKYKAGTYLIGPEDVLEISVWKNPDLSRVVTVRPDGWISLPLLGDIKAAGRTPEDLKREIVSRLKEYQETAIASVIVQGVNSYKIFLVGEIKNPGVYTLKERVSLLQAIAMAGGFTEFASKETIILIRQINNSEIRIRLKFSDLVNEKGSDSEKSNLKLKSGDTIFVPGKTIF